MTGPTFIFDYDGTICDTLDAISDALAFTFQRFAGVAPDRAEIAALVGTGSTLEQTMRALGAPEGASAGDWIACYRSHYDQLAASKVKLFDGVPATLDALRRVGPLVLLSNKGTHAVEASLRHLGIHRHFDLVLGEAPGQPRKPQAEVFALRIAPALPGIDAASCIVVGDTAADLAFARNIGARSCFARYGYGDLPRCEAIGYTHALNAFSELAGIYAASAANA